tara:strand:+ start:2979 stop:4262 length:1284 start_codon:yes stop_codon:yes gene_type:complete
MKIIKVGRGKNNDVILNDSTVSRNHLEIFFGDDGLVVVTDLNSANGTTVNGKKITGSVKLDSLDILKAGNSLIKWKNYLKDSNENVQESNTEIKQEEHVDEIEIEENDINFKNQSKNFIKDYKKELITLSVISFLLIIAFLFKDEFQKVEGAVTMFEKVETLYTNYVEPIFDNVSLQKKQRTDVTYDFTCMNNNPENEIINGLGDFKRVTDDIFLSDVEVSINDEIKMGNNLLKSYQSQYTVITSGEIVNYLRNILDDLNSRIAKPRGFNYQIYYIKGEPDNVITSGGKIFVFEKFYKSFKNSSEVAAVLAHEIAHNEIGHLTGYVKKQKAANDFGVFGQIFLDLEKAFTPPSFNQKEEVQADLFGIDLVQPSPYNPCSSIDFWKRLADSERQRDSYENFMTTHPTPISRLRCLRNHLKSNYNINCN